MGMNKEKFGFWDNRQSYNVYQVQGNYNKEKSAELFKEKIENKLIL